MQQPRFVPRRVLYLVIGLQALQLSGCPGSAPQPADPAAENGDGLELIFPESLKSWGEDFCNTLAVDGKDFGTVTGSRRRMLIRPKGNGKTAKVVFSYWPNGHTNIIRSREVVLQKGKRIEVDLRSEDPAFPDRIKATFTSTSPGVADKMCALARIGKDDVVYDIGCGDGQLIITALEKFHAQRGVGIDIDPELIKRCRENSGKAGVGGRAEFRVQDALNITDLSDASVVMLYVGEQLNEKLRPVLQKTLKPGARVVSHRFKIPGWEPDETLKVKPDIEGETRVEYPIHLWIIKGNK
jgi:SAM-dependent methyltransferase